MKFVETVLVINILLTCCQYRSREERIITVLWVLVWCQLYSRHVQFTQKEQIDNHKVVAERWLLQEKEDLVGYKVPCKWVLFKVPTIPMMSDYEEDLDDFPTFSAENTDRPAELKVGAYRAETTDQRTAAKGITTKIPPLFDGSTSWFKKEEEKREAGSCSA